MGGGAPYCPTEDEPPIMNVGFPLKPEPPSSQGAGKLAVPAFGSWFQIPVITVARPSGIDATWSNEYFSGIWPEWIQFR